MVVDRVDAAASDGPEGSAVRERVAMLEGIRYNEHAIVHRAAVLIQAAIAWTHQLSTVPGLAAARRDGTGRGEESLDRLVEQGGDAERQRQ